MKTTKLFQQVRMLNPQQGIDKVTDVLVEGNIIKEVNQQIQVDEQITEVVNSTAMIFAPALVDLYSSSGEPGYEARETLESLALAAKTGGFATVGILPHTKPVIDNINMVSWLKEKTNTHQTSFNIWGSLTTNSLGENIAPLADLAEGGVIGFTDNRPYRNLQLVRKLLEYAQPFHLPIALVASNLDLRGEGVMREGKTSFRLGLPGIPEIAESIALAAILEIVALTKTPVHLMRISTAREVELIQKAKENNLPITASVNWHHLLLNTETISSYNPNLRFTPPLGQEIDRLALVEGLKTGIIDAIAVDHQPYTYEEKTVAFAQAPTGAIGLELALPLLWETLVTTGELSALQLWTSLSVNPLKCFGQKPMAFEEGKPSEFIVFAPQQTWQVTPSQLQSLSYNTYWLNKQVQGKVLCRQFSRDNFSVFK